MIANFQCALSKVNRLEPVVSTVMPGSTLLKPDH
jgi:hypothetical protein